jgi:N-succinyl-L-ornithine transcarbamylase
MDRLNNAHYVHCLPIDRGFEATSEFIDSPRSLISTQMKNRELVQAGILKLLCEKDL